MARTSARSSATRDEASSPPKHPSNRQSQSPVGRRTRSTRSRSTDPGEIDIPPSSTRRGGKRGARQVSVESIDSNTSSASSRAGRPRKVTRAAGARNLSMVAEGRETEDNEGGEDEIKGEDEDDEADNGTTRAQRSHSPGGMSQISGTTAISSFSARTSHSQGEIGALDPMASELLPDLFIDSYRIMSLLAPVNASEAQMGSIVRQLKLSGSRPAKKLMQLEKRFGTIREHFGNEPYIKTTVIFQRLLGTPEPAEASFRPDAIIHAANLATLVKDFLVMEKESQSSQSILGGLDSYFPQVFVSKFANSVQYGNSILLDESFEVALNIRTQLTIVAMSFQKEQEDAWDPDQILLATFYDPPQHRSPPLSDYEDTIRNGRPKDLMGAGSELTDDQTAQVLHRMTDIRSAFRQSNDAIEHGDLVDFDQLEEMFPWLTFLTDLVQWSRIRLDEIEKDIEEQGGAESIAASFIEAIKIHDSQVDINLDPPPPSLFTAPRKLQPAAEIMPGPSEQSLYNGDKRMVRLLEQFKRTSSSSHEAPAPTQQITPDTSSSAPELKSKHEEAPRAEVPRTARDVSPHDFDNNMTGADDGDEPRRPTEEYAQVWRGYSNERNKENRPAPKRRLVDPQPGARQLRWDSQDDDAGPSTSTNKRKYQAPAEAEGEEDGSEAPEEARQIEEEDLSEDEGFQQDRRVPDPHRRLAAPVARRQSPVQDAPSPRKRQRSARPGGSTGNDAARGNQQRAESAVRPSARRVVTNEGDEEEEEEEDEDAYPPPTYSQASRVAKLNDLQARSRMGREPQRRVPWSETDTELLIEAIEEFGCSWSLIAKKVEFEHPRDQVALKDRARNVKVNLLKSKIALPLNLEKVPLGKKEIESVRRVDPDYEP